MILQGRNLTQGLSGNDVAELQSELAKLQYRIPATEQQGSSFGTATVAAVKQFQTSQNLPATGTVDDKTAAALTAVVADNSYTVTGRVSSPTSAAVGALALQLIDANVGGNQVLATGQTNSDGTYAFNNVVIPPDYLKTHFKTQPDLQVQVQVLSGTTPLAASSIHYNAALTPTINVVLPGNATGLPSEYETLTASLSVHYGGKLGALEQSSQRRDITYLDNKSGWDARAIAMAALADQFSAITAAAPASTPAGAAATPKQAAVAPPPPPTVSLQPEFYYALFRAGLPSNADLLFQTGISTVQTIWRQAIAQNVIPQSLSESVPKAAQAFSALSAAHVLGMPPPIGVSKLQDMIAVGLQNGNQQQQFAQLLTQYRDDWTNFWPAVEKTIGTQARAQMQLLGQLYFLTVNNAPLITALNNAEVKNPLTTPLDLASRGYYDPAKWTPLIGASIPPAVPGATVAEQAKNYANALAAQVRISFPTAVVADQVKRGIVPIADTPAVANEVSTFLATNQDQFGIGVEPVDAFIARTKVAPPSAEARTQIKRIQRVYQLTQDDASMSTLLRHNLDSAHSITRYDLNGFVRAFQNQLGGSDKATAIHRRSKQIFSAVLNIASSYANARISPGVGGSSPIVSGYTPPTQTNAVIASATLDELFGSLDYCNCSDCNSILSPAAYLVDLLHYLDQPSPTPTFSNPQTVLFERRPDLQYLPLTCANTNTALPYIDVVNETLEYFVANSLSLESYHGHDTGTSVTAAELLASPQYVNDTAYTTLQNSFFPVPLPFNRSLELLRLQLQNMGVALPDAMIALRGDDSISNPKTPTSYGWSDILIEQLGMSRQEYRIFTDPNLQLGDLYGIPQTVGQTTAQWNAAVLATLQTMNLQDLCKRAAISYADLVAILETQFINPSATLIPKVQLLNAPFLTLQTLHDNLNTSKTIAPEFIAALPAGLDATQYGGSSPLDYQAVVDWVTSAQVYNPIMGLIVIANPSNSPDDCSGVALQLRYSIPDNAQNPLSATDFLKLIRFIRLWQKLQTLLNNADDIVTIAQTDAILGALYPANKVPVQTSNKANDPANRPLLDAGFGVALLRAGFLFQVMNRLSLNAGSSLEQLLACWAPIWTVGPNALYQNMFLTPTLLQQDPGAQIATVSDAINAGDVLAVQINNVIITHPVAAGETAAMAATAIAAAINTSVSVDQVSGAPLNKRFVASAQGEGVIIKAGFALGCKVTGAQTESYAPASSSPISQTATVGGTATAGDTLLTTIDTVPITYTVAAGDLPPQIAVNIAAAINGTTAAHPYSGLPLNQIVAASTSTASPGLITITAANAGAPFTLSCSITASPVGTYTVGTPASTRYTAAIAGVIKTGDVLSTAVNGVPVPYTALATDTTTTILAASIASAINNAVQQDPTTLLPIGSVVHATSANNVVTITPIDPATAVTVTGTVTTGSESYTVAGPISASQTATVAGPIPAGAVLTTTINGFNLYYTVATGDTATTIAANISQSVATTTSPDPVSNLPLSSVVSAAAAGGVVTVTATNATTFFTLGASVSAATFTTGRLLPPFADNGYGAFLSDPTQTLFGHEPLLCAACNLSGADFALIASSLGYDAATPLTLANVSALFRYGWLAHALNISVLEFLRLREFSGLDPFAQLDPGATTPIEPAIIRFIRLLQAMSAAGLQSVQALYLIWNQDISGTSAPTQAEITALASALRADFAAVEAQFVLQDDPSGSIAQGLMTLVYGTSPTDFFFGLLNNTFSVAVPYSYASPTLPQPMIDASAGLLSYDDMNKELRFAGVFQTSTKSAITAAATVTTTDSNDNAAPGNVTLTPAKMTNVATGTALLIDGGALQEIVVVTGVTATTFTTTTTKAHNGTTTPFSIVNDPTLIAALGNLAAANAQAVAPFFATYPELQPLYAAYASSTAPLQTKRTALLSSFLPTLKRIRKEEQALAAITAAVGSDPTFASALLQDPTILHADADATAAAVTDLTAIENAGLSAQFFLGNNPLSPPDQVVDCVSPVSYVQTATITGTAATGITLTTTINGNPIPYATTASDTSLPILAGNLAAAINATTTMDATSGLPINRLVSAAVLASSTGNVIAISGLNPVAASSVVSLACAATAGTLSYTAGSELPAGNGGNPIAVIWSGYITAPQNGSYNFAVVADPGAAIQLQIDGEIIPMPNVGGVCTNQVGVELVAGPLVPILLTATSLKTTLAFSWQSPPGLGWELVPSEYLYPLNLVGRLGDTYVRFLKATSLSSALSLVADEIAYLGTNTNNAVNTSCATKVAPGSVSFTPNSIANIAVGSVLVVDTGSAQEAVTVTAKTATTFTAVTARGHDGTSNPFPIVSQASPNVETGWLNFLPGMPDPDPINKPIPDLPTAARLGNVLSALLDFSRIKQALSSNDERLLKLLQNPAAVLPNGQTALVSLTGWAQVSVNALLTQFFNSLSPASLGDVENFRRVYDAYQIVQTCRVAASTLIAAVTNAPTPSTVSALQSALRALYAESDWLTVIRPINDTIRIQQRDALVAYILQGFSNQPSPPPPPPPQPPPLNTIDTPDKLFEYFLIDPETQPPVDTSRIQLALASVQLFIERIVRGLEPQISPGDVDATQWQWMKRYRVWQANREVFLWPENWLYPELRDDQSEIFQNVMGSLLQSDITDDAAAEAYLDYLSNLEEVAKLEPCGIYYQPGTPDIDETAYVISRTAGAHRKYFFRQLQGGSWTPWAEVKIECEDMPITPIVWNTGDGNRLFLFWLKILKQSPVSPSQLPPPSDPNAASAKLTDSGTTIGMLLSAGPSTAQAAQQVVVQAVLCWSEFYNGKWQPTKTSEINRPTTLGTYDPTGPDSFDVNRSLARIVPAECTGNWNSADVALPAVPNDALILAIATADKPFDLVGWQKYGGFVLHNTHSLPIRFEDFPVADGTPSGDIGGHLDVPAPARWFPLVWDYTGAYSPGTFYLFYFDTINSSYYGNPVYWPNILGYNWMSRYVQPQPGLPDAWDAPFLYEDRRRIFYVTTAEDFVDFFGYVGFGTFFTRSALPVEIRAYNENTTTLAATYDIGQATCAVSSIPTSWVTGDGLWLLVNRGQSTNSNAVFRGNDGTTCTLGANGGGHGTGWWNSGGAGYSVGSNVELVTKLAGYCAPGTQVFPVHNARIFSGGEEVTLTPTGATAETLTIEFVDPSTNQVTTTTPSTQGHASGDIACLSAIGPGYSPQNQISKLAVQVSATGLSVALNSKTTFLYQGEPVTHE